MISLTLEMLAIVSSYVTLRSSVALRDGERVRSGLLKLVLLSEPLKK